MSSYTQRDSNLTSLGSPSLVAQVNLCPRTGIAKGLARAICRRWSQGSRICLVSRTFHDQSRVFNLIVMFAVFNPPICPVNGSAVPGIERAGNYMARVLSRLQTDRLQSVCVKAQAQKEFNQWVQSRMPDMVWSGPCNSWCTFMPYLLQRWIF